MIDPEFTHELLAMSEVQAMLIDKVAELNRELGELQRDHALALQALTSRLEGMELYLTMELSALDFEEKKTAITRSLKKIERAITPSGSKITNAMIESARLYPLTELVPLVGPMGKTVGFRSYMCCPFHEEKSPSFCIYLKSNTYHCFGCAKNGNPIDFLMEHEGLSFIQAVLQLTS